MVSSVISNSKERKGIRGDREYGTQADTPKTPIRHVKNITSMNGVIREKGFIVFVVCRGIPVHSFFFTLLILLILFQIY